MTIQELERVEDTIDWDELTPPCDSTLPCPNSGIIASEWHHITGGCKREGEIHFFCEFCWNLIKGKLMCCIDCDGDAFAREV